MPITPVKSLVQQANEEVKTLPADEACSMADDPDTVFIDLREENECRNQGMVKNALHIPRGFLEFAADPESEMHEPRISKAKRLILYCGSGGRSALAAKTLKDMGYDNIAHVAGGFGAWCQAGGPTQDND